ncbi:MAG TPA: signal recognition particle protein, partial [Bryobacterales bacterium]|nr:signal recognition particle protein [Bryobacterales bacterium]
AGPSPEELEKMQAELAGMDPESLPPELRDLARSMQEGGGAPALPKGLPGTSGLPGLGGGLPGLGGGLPGLGGLPPVGRGKKRR